MHKRMIRIIITVLALGLSLCGCSLDESEKIIEMKDAHIGMVLQEPEFYSYSYGALPIEFDKIDYFDSYAYAQLSLSTKRIDGFVAYTQPANEMLRTTGEPEKYNVYSFGVDTDEWLSFLCSEVVIGQTEDVMLHDEFRDWLNAFRETDEYKDILERSKATRYGAYESKEVKTPENAERVLRVGHSPTWVLYAQIDAYGNSYGPAIEVIKHFAADMGYGIEVFQSQFTQAFIELPQGKMDMFLCGLTYSSEPRYSNIRSDFKCFPIEYVFVTRSDTEIEGLELIEDYK